MLPILPDSMSFFFGFGVCAALIFAGIAVKKAWPKVQAMLKPVEDKITEEIRTGVAMTEAKVNRVASAAAKAINQARGDIAIVHGDIEWIKARLIALETAVGIAAAPVPTQPPSP